jgi:MFS transporter, OFA family, oxalate/formate antiporter
LSDRIGKRGVILSMFAISALTCGLLLPRTADFWRVLTGICIVGFCYGGYLALMPSLCAEYFGSKQIGANYGLLFTAWGSAGFVMPRFVATMLEGRKHAGDLAGGYNQMFWVLAFLAVVGLAVTMALRKPTAERS